MELALSLGSTVDELSKRMTLREYVQWKRFAHRRMLPMQRIELMLARLIASWTGEKVEDLLIRPVQTIDGVDDNASDEPIGLMLAREMAAEDGLGLIVIGG